MFLLFLTLVGSLTASAATGPALTEPKLKAEAFTEDYFEKAAVLYYFKDGKFERYTTGD